MAPFVARPTTPELTYPGDKVAVSFPGERGLFITYTGKVHSVRRRGNVRQFLAQEGAVIFSWTPGAKASYKLSLLDRDPEPQSLLEGLDY